VEVERLTIDWIRQILGFNAEAGGLFVSGGSMANLAAIAAAREAKDSSSDRLRMYASSETHFSIAKAAALLGIGRQNVRDVAVDEHFRIRLDDLVAKITADLEAGYVPFCVIANGAFAVLAESARKLFGGIEQADSIALDPHKWLYLPVDVGCVIYRDPEVARAAFTHEAEYTRIIGEEADEAFAYWDYGPELSRRFRALKVWMLLKGVGLESLSEAIENNIACARYFESMVRESDDFEMIAPVELSIFCFRHVPIQLRSESDQAIDALNERLLVALQRDGSSYLSNATLGGRFALRGCVLNYRTTLQDMEILLDDLRRVARSLATSA
jgi:glutamate/tyrosine decarboxylase-like PLP-dependent enzyme